MSDYFQSDGAVQEVSRSRRSCLNCLHEGPTDGVRFACKVNGMMYPVKHTIPCFMWKQKTVKAKCPHCQQPFETEYSKHTCNGCQSAITIGESK